MDGTIHTLRAREFSRLDARGHIYLDYTGSGLYPESLVRRHAELLEREVLGNPHSHNPSSSTSTELVESARDRIRSFFHAERSEYEVVFTHNATGALKLVGESFPFEPGSRLVLTADNHNSVNGIREFAARGGATVSYIPLDAELRSLPPRGHFAGTDPARPNLFAYPAQSNFSGVKHPPAWLEEARSAGYDVLLDAAAYVPSNPLDLSEIRPDFVCVSFYKMFGYPTGVGALIARRAALARLRRPWFAGGTVRFASAQNQLHLLQPTAEAFEDGTLNFLGISAVGLGLELLEEIGMTAVQRHVGSLTERMLSELQALKHRNGEPLVTIYGPPGTEARGGTVAFNLQDPDGDRVECDIVERRAAEHGISLRTGCFCNPGAAEASFGYDKVDSYRCFNTLSPEAFTLQQFSSCMNDKAVGAVRVSLGMASTAEDVLRLAAFLRGFIDTTASAAADRSVPATVAG